MHGHVVDALLGLLDDGFAVDFPAQFGGITIDLLQSLVDRNGADGNRRVADDAFTGLVDALAGGQIHDGVGAPSGRPDHLLDLFGHRGGHGGVADVGVDLDQELLADDGRFGFGVVAIDRDHGPADGHLVADELGVHAFPFGHEAHFGGDGPGLGVGELAVGTVDGR